jgi:hypothetical protein
VQDYKPKSRYTLLAVAAVLLLLLRYGWNSIPAPPVAEQAGDNIESLIRAQARQAWVETDGSVIRLLPDDREGAAHQRFILRLASGRTVLVAHNIDLARRIPLHVGDIVRLRGRYEWNEKGGVIHWTHHDPGDRKSGGWIESGAVRYQ